VKAALRKRSIMTLIIALVLVAALAASPVFGVDAGPEVGGAKPECMFDYL
jgi:hypothetical protein